MDLCWQSNVSALNRLCRLFIAFLSRSKCLLTSCLQEPSAVILEPKKIKSVSVSIVSPFAMKWWDWIPWSLFFECWAFSQFFSLSFYFHQEALQFLFTFCHKGGVICISEVIDISPRNLDSSLFFIQLGISHDVLYMKTKVKSLRHVRLFATLWTVAYQASRSMRFSRQEYWSGLTFPSPGGSSQPRDQTQVSFIADRRFTIWATSS